MVILVDGGCGDSCCGVCDSANGDSGVIWNGKTILGVVVVESVIQGFGDSRVSGKGVSDSGCQWLCCP